MDHGDHTYRTVQPRDPDLATITRRPTLRSAPWAALRRKRRRTRSGAQVAAPGACSAAARVGKARVRRRPARIPNPSLQPHVDPDRGGMVSSAVHAQQGENERAVRPYCGPFDGWPSNAIRRACGAIQRTSVRHASRSGRLRGGMVSNAYSGEEAKVMWCCGARRKSARCGHTVRAGRSMDGDRMPFGGLSEPFLGDIGTTVKTANAALATIGCPSPKGECSNAVRQVTSPGASSTAARVGKARVRRRPARIPNPSLQPRDPDLATITRRPTLRSALWATLRQKRRRTRCRVGGVARCMLCSRAREQGSGSRRPARIPNPSLQPRAPDLATTTRRPTLRLPTWTVPRLERRRIRCRVGGVARRMLCGRACEQGSG